MTKYKKHLTDEDIQVLKNTMQKHDDIKPPIELMTQSIVTEQEKGLLRLMYFRFTDYEQQKQRADYLEKYIKIMRDNYSEINKDTQTILRTAHDDVLLKAQIRWNNDVIKILDKILEDDDA